MESVSVAILIFMFCVSLILGSSNSYVTQGLDYVATVSESSKTYEYERIDEVKKHCAFVLSSATELKPDSNWVHRIKEELKFGNGDWKQDVGNAPIMPFHDRDMPKNLPSYLNVVSFWVTDADIAHQSKKSVSVSGVLVIGKTRDISDAERLFEESPQFQMWPGHSLLTILFEGIYAETKKKGGERVMCMLGSAMLPSRESDSSEPWGWMKASGSNYSQPPLSQDDQILLVLHYPMNFRLTSRTIQGEMTSLNSKSNLKHFDSIHILSQLGDSAKYEFLSEAIVSKACHPYPCQDNLMTDVIKIYKGHRFCEILQQVTRGGAFTVVPNWRCNDTDEFCSKLGPFGSDKEIRATDGSFKDVPLFMQNLKCEEALGQGNVSSARVAAVFRASPPSGNEYSARWRSDPSNMTVAAEGLWKSSSGQLCMIGCPGLVDSEGSSCNSRILLYVPLSFSIKQRSIILGSFSSTNDSDASYFPLSFEKLVQPMELWNYFKSSRPYYRYSKLEKAGVLLEKKEPFSVGTVIKKSLLHYPKLEDTESFMNSLSLLSEDLTLQISAVPDPLTNSQTKRVYVQVEILSLGPLFGRYWSLNNTTLTIEEDTPYHTDVQYTEKQLLMNVSAQLSLIGEGYQNLSVVFLEGLYDPHFGKMYLVGCRDVRASWNILFESMDLEGGLDCLINVVVTYPSTTTRWFVNPKAKISISSQRTEDDPLYFKSISLQTLPIMYRKQREDILSHMGVEGILRMVTLSFAIACISSQLFYIKHDLDSVPFISLVMLVVQALGYCLPLITDAEALFKRMTTESYESPTYDLEKNQWIHIIDYAVKILVMVSFLLTLRLCQKVWKSRIRLLTRTPLEPHRIPSEKWVLLGTLTIHVVGYVFVLIINAGKTSQRSLRRVYIEPAGYSHEWKELEIELEEYMGLVQDFFLLPQVIGNLLWQIDCKPLRKRYFIGITVVRLLPHVYDYIRTPPNPYFDEDYEFVNPNLDFFSKFGDIAIPAMAIFLAAVVYIQQRWSYDKLSQTLTFGHCRLLPMGSRVYERLPSKSFEAELVSGVDGNAAHETERDDED